jgi:hypothetical protein
MQAQNQNYLLFFTPGKALVSHVCQCHSFAALTIAGCLDGATKYAGWAV